LIPLDDISQPVFGSARGRVASAIAPLMRAGSLIGWGARKFYTETPTYRELKPGNVLPCYRR